MVHHLFDEHFTNICFHILVVWWVELCNFSVSIFSSVLIIVVIEWRRWKISTKLSQTLSFVTLLILKKLRKTNGHNICKCHSSSKPNWLINGWNLNQCLVHKATSAISSNRVLFTMEPLKGSSKYSTTTKQSRSYPVKGWMTLN